jgi:Flp pilus assembly protein TadG
MKQVHSERGAVLVEFAMMLPLLILLIIGIIDFGLILREHQILQNAAREGSRFSAGPRNWVNATVNPAATQDAIKQRVVDYLAQENITISPGDVTVSQSHPITVGGLTVQGSEITVTYTRSLLVGGAPLLPFGDITLTGQSVFRNLY